MATLTTNYGLAKPDTTDFYDIAVQNSNMEAIDTALTGKAENLHVHPIYGACDTASATEGKAVTLSAFALSPGAMAVVKFTNGNTSDTMTLNVNGTGAKAVLWQNASSMGFHFLAGSTATFLYNGTNWVLLTCDDFANPTAKMEMVSYVGTGTYGSGNPNSITFSITPVVFMISGDDKGTVYPVTFPDGDASTCVTRMAGDANWYTNISLLGNTVSWYSSSSWADSYDVDSQLNKLGETYMAIAWGY